MTAVLLVGAAILLLREQRASFLRPGLRLNAYVSTEDGSVAVVDLVRLRAVARVGVGPGWSGMREHPTRAEVWGVSSQGGYVWVLNVRANQVAARVPVGATPYVRVKAVEVPAVTLGIDQLYQRLMAPRSARITSFTPLGAIPSGAPSGACRHSAHRCPHATLCT